ncbi:MAG: S41 family peptidase [Patescibacteria group bacterium]
MAIKKNLILIGVGVIFLSFTAGFFLGESFGQSKCLVCPPADIDLSLFWEAYSLIQERFVDASKLNDQKLIEGAAIGMVKALEDPHTVLLNPSDTKKFLEEVSGRFEGIGMEIGKRNEELQVISPLQGTPAQRAGLRPGDRILKIGDTITSEISVDEAVSMIRGPKNTEVTLTIFRQGWDKEKEIKIVRAIIDIPSLKWDLVEDDIAHIQLYNFSEKADFDFSKAAFEILNSPAKKIILDLRNNPGGYLEVAQDIAGWFLEEGQVVTIEDFGGKQEQQFYKAQGNAKFKQYPIVILINQGSASGSEILAGSLRDNRQVKLIGEKSFGKGSVQELESLRKGYSLKITIAHWLTPKGEFISEKGLEPDIKIEMTEKDYEEEKDPQLDKAIEIIKNL